MTKPGPRKRPVALMTSAPLGIGFVGSDFSTRFHTQALQAVRDTEVRGVMRWSSLDSGLELVPHVARGTWTP